MRGHTRPAQTPVMAHILEPQTSLEIAQAATLRPIEDVAEDLGLEDDELELFGGTRPRSRCRRSRRRRDVAPAS